MLWNSSFDDPVSLPDGRELVTLSDARSYILKLGRTAQNSDEWQAAIAALMAAAEGKGPLLHARIGVLRALNHGKPDPKLPRKKRPKVYRIIR